MPKAKIIRNKRAGASALPTNYRELQALAIARGIRANQSKKDLIEALS